jgi:dTDP-4-dehydrorhamnose 3,5-epimerase
MEVVSLAIDAVKLIRPQRISDPRGYFSETWNRKIFSEHGIDIDFVQDNASWSAKAGTLRGLHFQRPPRAQAKLVRAARGSVFDVAVDLRRNSPAFGRHVSAVLTAQSGDQLLIPAGFAHGFCTLEDATEVLYKTSDYYSPEHEAGVRWDDVALGIVWPLGNVAPTISERDRKLPSLNEITGSL